MSFMGETTTLSRSRALSATQVEVNRKSMKRRIQNTHICLTIFLPNRPIMMAQVTSKTFLVSSSGTLWTPMWDAFRLKSVPIPRIDCHTRALATRRLSIWTTIWLKSKTKCFQLSRCPIGSDRYRRYTDFWGLSRISRLLFCSLNFRKIFTQSKRNCKSSMSCLLTRKIWSHSMVMLLTRWKSGNWYGKLNRILFCWMVPNLGKSS